MVVPAGGTESPAVVIRSVGGTAVPSGSGNSPPSAQMARPAGIQDLPPELRAQVFGHLWAMAAVRLTDAVPPPVEGAWAATPDGQDSQSTAPLVTSRIWMARAGAAQVCRAFRVALHSSVEHLCVEVSCGGAPRGQLEVVLRRWAALAETVHRLASLRKLHLWLRALRLS